MNIDQPVVVWARRDDALSRWLWLVKWLLLIPHYIVLVFLWFAFWVLTLIAAVVVLFTRRYPAGIHRFNVGVMRWSWRVSYYGYGVLGTDRYPPFTLKEVPTYPAGLHIAHPERLPRWRALLSWLLAIPHLVIVNAFFTGFWGDWNRDGGGDVRPGLSLASTLVLIVALMLLVTGRRPHGLYDLLVGFHRWAIRAGAYAAFLTTPYPPFRLDMGDHDVAADRVGPATGPPH